MSARVLIGVAILGVFLLISGVGCAPPVEEEVARPRPMEEKCTVKPARKPAKLTALALKFTEGEFGRYKSVSETGKDYRFEQPAKEESKDEHSGVRTEVIFSQHITQLGEDGSALAEITIQGLKCYSAISQDVRLDFDSSREGAGSEPMAKLIGQSYLIRMFPDGTVRFVDAAKARTAVREGRAARLARSLLSAEAIEARHSIPALLGRSQTPARRGQRWSTIEQGPRGMLQVKSYNKAYRLTETREEKGQRIAVVQMQAKAVETAGPDGETVDLFTQMFKGADNYTGEGELILNLDTGKVEKSSEKLKASWIATDPNYDDEEGGPGPDVLVMGFTRSRSIERID